MIVSRQNQKVKDIRRLRRCKGDQAILEGPHLVGEALRAELTLDTVLATENFLASQEGRDLESDLPIPVTLVAPHLIDYLSDTDSPRGVMAVATLPRGGLESIPVTAHGHYLFVDGLQDPGNLGALIRVAEAFSVAAVLLAPGSAHPNHPRTLRSSAGSALRVPIGVGVDAGALATHLDPIQPLWVGLTPRGGGTLADLPADRCLVLAVGAEGPGLSGAVLARIQRRLTIPLGGRVESLNSTVAAAIALHDLDVRRSAV